MWPRNMTQTHFIQLLTSQKKKWLPKSISIFSESPCDDEALYNPGSFFEITNHDNDDNKEVYKITLKNTI